MLLKALFFLYRVSDYCIGASRHESDGELMLITFKRRTLLTRDLPLDKIVVG